MGDEGTWNPIYYQDEMPVRELSTINGHAVRAMYLFCGMADVASLKGDTGYIHALDRLWDDVVLSKMYITGGIGSSRHNEGFTEPFDLPNYEAYWKPVPRWEWSSEFANAPAHRRFQIYRRTERSV